MPCKSCEERKKWIHDALLLIAQTNQARRDGKPIPFVLKKFPKK